MKTDKELAAEVWGWIGKYKAVNKKAPTLQFFESLFSHFRSQFEYEYNTKKLNKKYKEIEDKLESEYQFKLKIGERDVVKAFLLGYLTLDSIDLVLMSKEDIKELEDTIENLENRVDEARSALQ